MNSNLNTISSWEEVPLFDSEQAEALFWSENRPDARLMEGAVSGASETSESVAISLRIDPRMLSRMKRLARARFLNYQSMMKQWLSERMELEMNNDSQMKNQNRNRQVGGFTLIEMLVVIAIIGILASMIVAGASIASRKSKLTRVKVQLTRLESAIEAYQKQRGYFPPDNSANSQTNTLYYELSGTTFNPADTEKTYTTLDGHDVITANAAFKTSLNVEGIQNASAGKGKADDAASAENYLKLKATEVETVTTIGGVTLKLLDVPVEGVNKSDINPWHYNSHNPTNSAEGFDLWAEFLIGGKTNLIGNWNHNVIVK
ncbi:MAG: hypothetical protein RL380_672 [Verrucomicrobiota bacterium]|jgi:prepilin-type N-terminal cleavage/methylation domain-containing protein